MHVIVGSMNPVKVAAAHDVFSACFPNHNCTVHGYAAPSGVAAQPMTAAETRQGAINRVDACRAHFSSSLPDAWYVAFEGGVDVTCDGPVTFAYVACHQGQRRVVTAGPQLPLPDRVYQSLLAGEELGTVMDSLFNEQNIKQRGGAIGQLTKGLASRQSVYASTLTLTLAPFHFPHWYS